MSRRSWRLRKPSERCAKSAQKGAFVGEIGTGAVTASGWCGGLAHPVPGPGLCRSPRSGGGHLLSLSTEETPTAPHGHRARSKRPHWHRMGVLPDRPAVRAERHPAARLAALRPRRRSCPGDSLRRWLASCPRHCSRPVTWARCGSQPSPGSGGPRRRRSGTGGNRVRGCARAASPIGGLGLARAGCAGAVPTS